MTDSSEVHTAFLFAMLTDLKFQHDQAVRLVPALKNPVWILLYPVGRSEEIIRWMQKRSA